MADKQQIGTVPVFSKSQLGFEEVDEPTEIVKYFIFRPDHLFHHGRGTMSRD